MDSVFAALDIHEHAFRSSMYPRGGIVSLQTMCIFNFIENYNVLSQEVALT